MRSKIANFKEQNNVCRAPKMLNANYFINVYFKSSFELTFNKTLEEFYVEWDSIMGKSIDDWVKLIDSFGF